MTAAARLWLFVPSACVLAAVCAWGVLGLPAVGGYRGPYGDLLNAAAPTERRISEVVTAVVFDYRGIDTLGEEFILFASVVGVALLLRKLPGEGPAPAGDKAPARKVPRASDAVRVLAVGLVGPTVLFGLYVVVHGHVSPGGGFQGGVILATAPLLVYLAGEFEKLRRIAPHRLVELGEAAGAAAYIGLGLAGYAIGAGFLANVLPLGTVGRLLSGGTVPLINIAVGLEVSAGFLLLLITFLEETLNAKEGQ